MSDPRAPQRRIPLDVAFEPIPSRFFRKFPPREARGDKLPIMGRVQTLSDGSPGGRPIPPPPGRISILQGFPMTRSNKIGMQAGESREEYKLKRKHAERKVYALRVTSKNPISLLAPLDKLAGQDIMRSVRWKPPVPSINKPSPPSLFTGGETRQLERNRAFPKDKSVSMTPVRRLTWHVAIPSPDSLSPSSAVAARFPKTHS
jgi:hypothetical protein